MKKIAGTHSKMEFIPEEYKFECPGYRQNELKKLD